MAVDCKKRPPRTVVWFLVVAIVLEFLFVMALLRRCLPSDDKRPTPLSQELSKLANQIDSEANPCEDFHTFVCGKASKNLNELHNNVHTFQAKMDTQMQELLEESTPENHIVLKTAIGLFKSCLAGASAEDKDDYFKLVLKSLGNVTGGWPLLLHAQWDESKFDWLQATYQLRNLGYPYSVFFKLSVVSHPRSNTHNIFKISLPRVEEFETEIVEQVAKLFGANTSHIGSDITSLEEFVMKLNSLSNENEEVVVNVDDYNTTVDWRQVINTLVGPEITMPMFEKVIFPPIKELVDMLQLLANTPKRILANYMAWKVFEEMANLGDRKFLHMVGSMHSNKSYVEKVTSREEDCLVLISNRFPVNPIAILYARKYITLGISQKAHELSRNVKEAFLKQLYEARWMDEREREYVTKRFRAMEIVIGAPEDYYDDQLLDEMNADLEMPSAENLLSFLLQVNKNYETLLLKRINSAATTKFDFGKLHRALLGIPHYTDRSNLLTVPLGFLEHFAYNDEVPTYMRYGSLGSALGSVFAHLMQHTGFLGTEFSNGNSDHLWGNKSEQFFADQVKCFGAQVKGYVKTDSIGSLAFAAVQHSQGVKVAYTAYRKWFLKMSEPKISGMDYTPKQMFWISSGYILCSKIQKYSRWRDASVKAFFLAPIVNNEKFSEDFNCPSSSKMNPHKCPMY